MIEPFQRPERSDPGSNIPAEDSVQTRSRGWQRFRIVIGITACVALSINLALALASIGSAMDSDASAVQIIQVWTPHIYYAVLITGFAVSLYIMSRVRD